MSNLSNVKQFEKLTVETDVWPYLLGAFKYSVKRCNESDDSDKKQAYFYSKCLRVLLEAREKKTISFEDSVMISGGLVKLLAIFNKDLLDWMKGQGDPILARDAIEYRKEISYVYNELANYQSDQVFASLMT